MLTGNVLFSGSNTMAVFHKIFRKEIDYPFYLSQNAKDLIDGLLEINPNERLGSPDSKGGIKSLKEHPFFNSMDFSNIKNLVLPVHILSQLRCNSQVQLSPIHTDQKLKRNTLMVMANMKGSDVVCRGYLLKKNRWFNK